MPGREGHNSRSLPASKPMAGPQRSRIFWDPDVSRYRLTTQRANDQIRHGNVYGKQGRIQKVELGEDGQCRSAAVSRKILEGSSKWGGENETPTPWDGAEWRCPLPQLDRGSGGASCGLKRLFGTFWVSQNSSGEEKVKCFNSADAEILLKILEANILWCDTIPQSCTMI